MFDNSGQPVPPLFSGQPIFGALESFEHFPLYLGTPAEIDAFLSLPEGTTKYGSEPAGGLFAVRGTFKDYTSEGVTEQLGVMQSYFGIVSTYRKLTGEIFPAQVQPEANCFFTAGDLTSSEPSQIGYNQWGLNYSLVIRKIGGSGNNT
jgi:hypothetical protein